MIGNGHAGFVRGGVGKGLTRAPRRRPYLTTFRLLLDFASQRTGNQPCRLDIDDLDAPLIGAFLTHLEHDRGNTPPDTQQPAGGDPRVLPLRRPQTPRAPGDARAGARDPDQALRAKHSQLPRPR